MIPVGVINRLKCRWWSCYLCVAAAVVIVVHIAWEIFAVITL